MAALASQRKTSLKMEQLKQEILAERTSSTTSRTLINAMLTRTNPELTRTNLELTKINSAHTRTNLDIGKVIPTLKVKGKLDIRLSRHCEIGDSSKGRDGMTQTQLS